MLGHARKRGVAADWTFYCTLEKPGALDDMARQLGARVIASPAPLHNQMAFMGALRSQLKDGAYEVLHCHHDLVSAVYLAAAAGLPMRRRLVHAHNADESVLTPVAWKQALYRPLMRRLCLATADRIVGISNHTLDTFLAGRPRRPGRDVVHYYGVDPAPFQAPAPDRAAFRRVLGLPEDALILLFGGRIVPEKNPIFVVEVLAALRKLEPRAVAVFAGAGSQTLETDINERATALGVAQAVRMIGWRSDLPQVMRCADWFILPRPEQPMEGFGLAVVEAQLAGLRLLVSRGLPDDPFLPSASFRRLALAEPAAVWAQAALELMQAPAPSQTAAFAALRASPLDMDYALERLMELHGA